MTFSIVTRILYYIYFADFDVLLWNSLQATGSRSNGIVVVPNCTEKRLYIYIVRVRAYIFLAHPPYCLFYVRRTWTFFTVGNKTKIEFLRWSHVLLTIRSGSACDYIIYIDTARAYNKCGNIISEHYRLTAWVEVIYDKYKYSWIVLEIIYFYSDDCNIVQ